jgi:hypothetical protein
VESPGKGFGEYVMNLSTDCQMLVDGYIDEVCVNLPRKKRADIAVEIRSLIFDALEDRSQILAADPDEEMVLAVLRDLGAPTEMAGAYQAKNYVIGHQMYAPFWMTVRGVLLFMGFFYVLAFLLSWGEATQSFSAFLGTIWGLIVAFFEDALRNFSVIFIIFVILERIIPEQDWVGQLKAWGIVSNTPFLRRMFGRTTAGEWKSQKEDAELGPDPIARRETIFEMVIILLVIILFNFFPHKIGIFGIFNGDPWFAPLLAPSFSFYLPWWNIYWLLVLTIDFGLLRQGYWKTITRWANVSLMVFSGLIVLAMLLGPSVLGLNPEYIDPNQMSPEALQFTEEKLLPVLATIFEIVLVVHLLIKIPHIFFTVRRLSRKPPMPFRKTENNPPSNHLP